MSPEDKKQLLTAALIFAAAIIILIVALVYWVFSGTIASIGSAVKQLQDDHDPLVNEKESSK